MLLSIRVLYLSHTGLKQSLIDDQKESNRLTSINDIIIKTLKGKHMETSKSNDALQETRTKYIAKGIGSATPCYISHGRGATLVDVEGNEYIDFAGGIDMAIKKTKDYLEKNKLDLKIIVEARSLDEIKQILDHQGIYRILIDNFDYETTEKAVQMIAGQCESESSGGITLQTARKYADCGVDYISSGALTHSVSNMDLSLKAI